MDKEDNFNIVQSGLILYTYLLITSSIPDTAEGTWKTRVSIADKNIHLWGAYSLIKKDKQWIIIIN